MYKNTTNNLQIHFCISGVFFGLFLVTILQFSPILDFLYYFFFFFSLLLKEFILVIFPLGSSIRPSVLIDPAVVSLSYFLALLCPPGPTYLCSCATSVSLEPTVLRPLQTASQEKDCHGSMSSPV